MLQRNEKIDYGCHKTIRSLSDNIEFSALSDFSFIKSLNTNAVSGRETFSAIHIESNCKVVIKKFNFLNSPSNWDGYKEYEKEINTLSSLRHHQIPRFLGNFYQDDSFYLIQEYVDAPSLQYFEKLPFDQVVNIASSLLDVLVYLQSRNPPVIHRDIKPENILYDVSSNQVYLIDFGLSKVLGSASTTVLGGTHGFMPPELFLGRKLGRSSDLYSLGITLVCLLSGYRSCEVSELINHQFEVDFSKALPSEIPWEFRAWLKNMVSADIRQRYPSASQALAELDLAVSPQKQSTLYNTEQVSKNEHFSWYLKLKEYMNNTYFIEYSLVTIVCVFGLYQVGANILHIFPTEFEAFIRVLPDIRLVNISNKEVFQTIISVLFCLLISCQAFVVIQKFRDQLSVRSSLRNLVVLIGGYIYLVR